MTYISSTESKIRHSVDTGNMLAYRRRRRRRRRTVAVLGTTASCLKNIHNKNYQNLIILLQITIENVRDFLRHSVHVLIHCYVNLSHSRRDAGHNTDNSGRSASKMVTLALPVTVSEIWPFIVWNFSLKIAAKPLQIGYYWQPTESCQRPIRCLPVTKTTDWFCGRPAMHYGSCPSARLRVCQHLPRTGPNSKTKERKNPKLVWPFSRVRVGLPVCIIFSSKGA